ncbi:MAG: fused MFS/spermidine synthase, partial [Acidobacteriota bacterium]|nr:fused MFS/spermidine synthase [Acidobacteriota bacterium]
PFFVLSTSGPLLQRWFSHTRHEAAGDPYFLYAASNAGSLLALVGYPLLLEPFFDLRQQSWLWSYAYAALVGLFMLCALALWRSGETTATDAATEQDEVSGTLPDEKLTNWRRLRWMTLAFVPSSLMLGVTTYISTDIASLPLLWVIPLGIYLLTLILAFARRQLVTRSLVARVMPGATIVLVLVYLSGATQPALFLALLHLLYLFIAALSCHGQLADDRPATRHLAEFYLWMSVGGALGGVLHAIVAPALFNYIVEYPLAILLAVWLRPRARWQQQKPPLQLKIGTDEALLNPEESEARRRFSWRDLWLPLTAGLLTVALAALVQSLDLPAIERAALMLGPPLIFSLFFKRSHLRFTLAVGAVMLASVLSTNFGRETLFVERNFFGVVRVARGAEGEQHFLYNGSTLHGRQYTALDRQCEPLSYYHREGPLGALFEIYNQQPASPHVAVVGLGTGATAAYTRPQQHWTFYEINPAVLSLARNPDYFTYLLHCAAAPVDVVLGDARLQLHNAPDKHFGLIILDAFSSDAIPVHLMTQEALDLYLSKLADGGLLAFHISNRSLDLHPVVADLARSRHLIALNFDDNAPNQPAGKEPSLWTVLARRPADFGSLAQDTRWRRLEGNSERKVWTDDFSNVVSILKW